MATIKQIPIIFTCKCCILIWSIINLRASIKALCHTGRSTRNQSSTNQTKLSTTFNSITWTSRTGFCLKVNEIKKRNTLLNTNMFTITSRRCWWTVIIINTSRCTAAYFFIFIFVTEEASGSFFIIDSIANIIKVRTVWI